MPPAKRKAEGAAAAAAPMREKRKAKKAKVASKQQKKKEKESETVVESENKVEEGDASENVLDASNKTIVVEHCKQCNSFKTRANQVKKGLEKADIGITVILNPEKDMKRPFKRMKDLDMDNVVSDIIDEISKAS
ncbi:hypothetical protein glysoja_042741 [Glycine soja]|uniref:Selenoprotein H n=1 Tax=Glycine soja TaxID=3848 RepID=A0A0B2NVP6_GLYSO|nr:hypothetical protein glysoja_042741 [Glycine soja]